ncbi:MAG: MFS transporter [Alphaproteobacteria bacterium]|nr:MFS transporter [Alphaproteobacteria bacterium]MDP6589360.1 MFS transporter [Alphaproteobacteria bacterium]MDP6818921.1 MFS transporter [Alphaproteobacteria bacterium]
MSGSASEANSNWSAILFAVGAGIVTAMQIGKVPPALPIIAEDLELSRVTAGLVASIFMIFGAVFGVALGAMADRFGERRLLFTGLVLLLLGSLIGGLVADVSVLLATRVLEGVGYIAVTVSAPKIIAGAARHRDLPLAIGIWSTFMPMGMAIIMVVSPFMLDGIGWQGVWLVNAAILAAFIAVLALGWRPQRHGQGQGSQTNDGAPPRAEAPPAFDWAGAKALMARPGPWLLGFIFTLYSLQWFAIMTWLPTFLIETQGRSLTSSSLFAALVVFVNVLGNIGGGMLLMRRGSQRWLLIGASLVVMAATVPLIFSTAVGADAKVPLAIAFSALTGLLPAACLAGAAAHAPSPAQNAMSNGFVIQGATIGSLLGPPIMGALTSSFGSWENFWWVMLIGPAIGLVLVARLRIAERSLVG